MWLSFKSSSSVCPLKMSAYLSPNNEKWFEWNFSLTTQGESLIGCVTARGKRPWFQSPSGALAVFQTETFRSLQIILSLAGTVRRDSSQMPHFPPSCKMLITCFQLEPRLSSWKSQAFLWKDGSALSLYFDMWWGASSDSGTKWEVTQLPFGKLLGLRTSDPLPYPLVGRNLPDCFFVPAKVPTQVVWLYLPHL